MHGRKRAEYKAKFSDPKVAAALEQKAQQWYTLSKSLVKQQEQVRVQVGLPDSNAGSNADSNADSATSVELTTKVLSVNPDPSWIWNMRRDLLGNDFALAPELALTAACLQRNPKAYGAWFHRKWVVQHHAQRLTQDGNGNGNNKNENDDESLQVFDSELQLTTDFLKLDERNFHCWNYRRFVVACKAVILSSQQDLALDGSWAAPGMMLYEGELMMGAQVAIANKGTSTACEAATSSSSTPSKIRVASKLDEIQELLQTEWDFSQTKIEENFSNCSAFHYRSKLIPLFFKEGLIQEELELVQNATFTEPDDQSAWWYHRFLIEYASNNISSEEFQDILQAEHEILQELVEEADGHCKWGLLALHMIGTYQIKSRENENENENDPGEDMETKREELNSYLDQLTGLDPDRKVRYQSMRV